MIEGEDEKRKELNAERGTYQTGPFGHKRPRPGDDPQMQVDSDCPDRWRMDGSGGVGFKAMLLLLALVPGTMNEELELDICIGSRVAD